MSSTPVKSPLRFCVSCAVTLACWVVWLALGAALIAQLYIAVLREVPVPDFVLRRFEARLAEAHLHVRIGRTRFLPGDGLIFENIRFYSHSFAEPLLTSRVLYLRKSFWSALSGRVVPDEIQLEGAQLQVPAPLSPSGTAEPVLRDLAATLRYDAGVWLVNQFAFRVGPLAVHARGEVAAPRRGPGGPLLKLDELTARYLFLARKLALRLPQLQAADQPVLDLQLQSGLDGGTLISGQFTAAALHRPAGKPFDLGPVRLAGSWLWSHATVFPVRLQIETTGLRYQAAGAAAPVAARLLRGVAVLEPASGLTGLRQVEAHLAVADLAALGENLDAPVFAGAYDFLTGSARLAVALRSYGALLAASAQGDLPRRAAHLALTGRIPPELVAGQLARHAPRLEPYLRLGDPVDFDADVVLNEHWRFGGLRTLVHGGRIDSHGVQITAARGWIDVDADLNFLAHDALLVAGENHARGAYWMNFRTLDYRMLLTGRLRPLEINGWFQREWWANFWTRFAFPAGPPAADVDVQGCYRDYTRSVYFGRTDARGPVVLGGDFERARTRIFLRPQYAHVLELSVARANGTQLASGWFKRYADFGTHQLSGLEYDLQGNVEPAVLARLAGNLSTKAAGASVQAQLANWRFPEPPTLHVWGHSEWDAEGNDTDLRFSARAPRGVELAHCPLDALKVAGAFNRGELKLDQVEFSAAGGTGTGRFTLRGLPGTLPPLPDASTPPPGRHFSFDVQVKDADLARAIRLVEDFQAARAAEAGASAPNAAKPAPLAGNKFLKRASGGKLQLDLAAQGRTDAPASLRGQGHAQISGTVLGEIHLFGLLSQVLSAVSLNFTSLKLDAARSSFQLADGRAHFPDVKITGPSAAIDAHGDYTFATKALDFTARLKPYEESHNPLTTVMGLVINPITRILELKLSGPLTKPSWSVSFGQSAPHAETPQAAEASPAKPQPPAN